MLASATGHPQAGSDDVELLVDFFGPPRLFCSTTSCFFKVPAPGGSTSTPEPTPAASCRIRILQYCGTFLSLHRHSAHLTKKIATVIYSIPSVVGYQKSRSQSRLIFLVYPLPESRVCKSMAVYAVRLGTQGEREKRLMQLRICTSIRTLTRALGPPPRPAQQRPDPDSQPQNQHPR